MLYDFLKRGEIDSFINELQKLNAAEVVNTSINTNDDFKWNLLHWAVHLQQENAVNAIIEKVGMAEFDQPAHDGVTPFLLACQCKNESLALQLLEKSRLNVSDHKKRGPLHWACKMGLENVAKHLIAKGADVTQETHSHKIPIDYAARKGHYSIVSWMLPMVKARSEQNQTKNVRPPFTLSPARRASSFQSRRDY